MCSRNLFIKDSESTFYIKEERDDSICIKCSDKESDAAYSKT